MPAAKKTNKNSNLEEFTTNIARIAEQSQKLIEEFSSHYSSNNIANEGLLITSGLSAAAAFSEMLAKIAEKPEKFIEVQMNFLEKYLELMNATAARMMGDENVKPVLSGDERDKRFKDEAWTENVIFDYLRQSYLLTSDYMQKTIEGVDGMDKDSIQKVEFYTNQIVDAMSPSNFMITNPEVIKETLNSNGENLVRGLRNLLGDLKKSKGHFNITVSDNKSFAVGKNLAVTPGKVVLQTDLLQLIQYAPTTKKVNKNPVVIISPWINKYYILDMRPENSFVKWLTDQGHTVFITSWVNPGKKLSNKSFEDYMMEGSLAAIDAALKSTGASSVNAIGYCIGGTLLSATLSYLKAKNKDSKVKSATYLTTLVDFSRPGDLGVFTDDNHLDEIEDQMQKHGVFHGNDMAFIFSLLRSRELIWSFVVNNYLLGKDPFPFDLLYWNADSTAMPATMHLFYLRNMYRKNLLIEKGGIELGGVKIDLSSIDTPSYIISTVEDHIAPWDSTYAAMNIYGGKKKFVLGGSGHVAGVVNPPDKNKYGYWENNKPCETPEKWFKGAKKKEGSWWVDWNKWILENKYDGGKVDARVPGKGGLKAIEDAPGSYVKKRWG